MTTERHLSPSPGLQKVAATLRDAGYQSFAVGGAVRDRLRGFPRGDWDVATDARPEVVLAVFERAFALGLEHGTVGVVVEGETIEITTFRKDVATDGRHAVVQFGSSIEEDLERRDFTINAIAWDPIGGSIVDPFGGRADLDAGVLRAVGDADLRFREDYLRVLRAFRFAVRLGLAIDPPTERGLRASAHGVVGLSGERVRDELLKTLRECRSASSALDLWRRFEVLPRLFPELAVCFGVEQNAFHADDVGTHTLLVTDCVHPRRPFLRLVALCHDLGKPVARHVNPETGDWRFVGHEQISERLTRQALRRWRFSRREVRRAAHLVGVHMRLPPVDATDATLRRWIRDVGEDHLWDLYRIQLADWWGNRKRVGEPPDRITAVYRRARRLLKEDTALSVADLAIDGGDLIELGVSPGPELGALLGWLLDRVLEEPGLNTRPALLALARERHTPAKAES